MGRSQPAPRRRILVIGPLPPPTHGVAVMTEALLHSPAARRFEMLHLDTADRRGVANIGRLDATNLWLALVHAARFITLLARHRVDMIYLPISKNSLGFLRDALFLAPALAVGVPVIVHFHGSGFDHFARSAAMPVRALVRLLLNRVARAVVLGEALRPMLRGLVAETRIAVVPNGVADGPRGVVPSRGRGGTMRLLFLGNLLPRKGYAELIEAVQTLLDEGIDVTVTFAGEVVDSAVHTRALAGVRYGADRIRFAGPVDTATKGALLREADVLVLPSDDEAQPLVILEAMAAGVAVVSTRHGVIPETVVDGETGILIDTRDAGALTGVLRGVSRQPGRLAAFGAAGRARYLAHYTVEQWADRMADVFESTGEAAGR
jgi:glycosyltransferase involved in cell wall biosynthesis